MLGEGERVRDYAPARSAPAGLPLEDEDVDAGWNEARSTHHAAAMKRRPAEGSVVTRHRRAPMQRGTADHRRDGDHGEELPGSRRWDGRSSLERMGGRGGQTAPPVRRRAPAPVRRPPVAPAAGLPSAASAVASSAPTRKGRHASGEDCRCWPGSPRRGEPWPAPGASPGFPLRVASTPLLGGGVAAVRSVRRPRVEAARDGRGLHVRLSGEDEGDVGCRLCLDEDLGTRRAGLTRISARLRQQPAPSQLSPPRASGTGAGMPGSGES